MPSIEQLVQQSKFRNERHKALVSILYANNLINNYFEELFNSHDLTLQQYNTLRILRGQFPKPCTINLIRERMLDKMSDASRIVERLRKAGFVKRVVSNKDRRAVDVLITKKGLNVLARLDKQDKEMNRPTGRLNEKEARQLNILLEKVFDSMIEE